MANIDSLQHAYDLVYDAPNGLTLDVHAPAQAQGLPTIVWFHGGGWAAGDSRQGEQDRLWPLAARGHVVVSVNYRLSQQASHPAQLEDAREALAWVAQQIQEFGGDPAQVFLAGASAGGHLAALAALADDAASGDGAAPGDGASGNGAERSGVTIRGVLPYFLVADPLRWDQEVAQTPRPASNTFSGRLADLRGSWPPPPRGSELLANTPADALSANVLDYPSNAQTPPFLILHGRRDSCVDVSHSIDLAQYLSENDTDATLLLLSHADHSDPQFFEGPVLDLVAAFVARHARP